MEYGPLLHPHKIAAKVFLGIALATGILALFLIYTFSTSQISYTNNLTLQAQASVQRTAQALSDFLVPLSTLADSLAHELSSNTMSASHIEAQLKKKPNSIFGVGVLMRAENKKEYAPYFVEIKGEEKLENLKASYDPADKSAWYYTPDPSQPFITIAKDPSGTTFVITYCAPFFDESGTDVEGIVFANQSAAHLQHFLKQQSNSLITYWFIASAKDGFLLAHPFMKAAQRGTTLSEIAEDRNNQTLQKAHEAITHNQPFYASYNNEVTNTPSFIWTQPVPAFKVSVGGVVDKDLVAPNPNSARHNHITVALLLLICFMAVLLAYMFYYSQTRASLWMFSLSMSGILILSMGYIWWACSIYQRPEDNLHTISSAQALKDFLDEVIPQEEHDKRTVSSVNTLSANTVPTGVYLTNISFVKSDEIKIVGYVWQHYYDGVHDSLEKGFTLPQQINASFTTVRELYRRKNRSKETIVWQVNAIISQDFNYRSYPFDNKTIEIQLWHKNFDKNVVLTPDFDSYPLMASHALPGVLPSLMIPNWSLETSSFAYAFHDYNSLFGMYKQGPYGIYKVVEKDENPELTFAVTLNRKLFDSLMSDVLPLAVIALLLFVVLLTMVQQEWNFLGACSGLFFGVIIAHMQFRTKTAGYDLVYFENFYFIMYGAILLVSLATYFYWAKLDFPALRFQEGLVFKLLYWPVMLSTIVLISVIYLY